MKITGWRALLASGALMFGTAAFAEGEMQRSQQQGSTDAQSQQEGVGGSGSEGSSETWSEDGSLGSGTGGSGEVTHDDRPFEEPQQGSIEMESESVEGSQEGIGGSGQVGQQSQGEGNLSGQVVETKGDIVFLKLEQGAVVPVKVSEQTTANKDGKELRGQKALKKVKAGDQLSIQVEQKKNENHASTIEFSGEQQGQPQELEGRIASVQGNWINLDHQGALIPLKADNQTQFQSQGDKQIQRASELKEGDEIRASFEVKGNVNNARSIEVTSATGGSSDQGLEQQPAPAPSPSEDPATGGSSDQGLEQQPAPAPSPSEEPLPPSEDPATGGSSDQGFEEPVYEEPSTGGSFEEGTQDDPSQQGGQLP